MLDCLLQELMDHGNCEIHSHRPDLRRYLYMTKWLVNFKLIGSAAGYQLWSFEVARKIEH